MFFTASYSRYAAELSLCALLALMGVYLNSQTLIALGILVLSHCLPSLVLATLRQTVPGMKSDTTTLYANSFCSFREKETVMLISSSLIIGFSIGLLLLSLEQLRFTPPFDATTLLLLGAAYILAEILLYSSANIRYKLKQLAVKKPLPSRIVRMVVASVLIVIAMVEPLWLQRSLDLVTGLAVLFYITFTSATTLIDIAKKNVNYNPRGIDVEDVKTFIRELPGVENVSKVHFRRTNEIDHELGVRVSLAPFIQNNTIELTDKIREQVAQAYGISSVLIELVQKPPEVKKKASRPIDDSVIILGHDSSSKRSR